MDNFDTIWTAARVQVKEHWQSCQESGLVHNSKNGAGVIAAIENYIAAIKNLKSDRSENAVIDIIQNLYQELDAINELADNNLLETDERELIVPIIVDIAVAAGLDAEDYDGEPGSEFRNF